MEVLGIPLFCLALPPRDDLGLGKLHAKRGESVGHGLNVVNDVATNELKVHDQTAGAVRRENGVRNRADGVIRRTGLRLKDVDCGSEPAILERVG